MLPNRRYRAQRTSPRSVSQLSPKQGVSLGDDGNGWSHNVYTATPGIPGDSGSAFLNSNGVALGILSTVQIAPLVGSNGVGDLNRELDYMRAHSSFGGVRLALGNQAFNGNAVANLLSLLGI